MPLLLRIVLPVIFVPMAPPSTNTPLWPLPIAVVPSVPTPIRLPVIPFRTDEEAVAIANDTEYGLSSGVITRDEARGLAIAARLDTGMCHINCSSVNDEPHVPFGGSKASGLGRHGGRWSHETFTETRWITLDRGGRPYPPMF